MFKDQVEEFVLVRSYSSGLLLFIHSICPSFLLFCTCYLAIRFILLPSMRGEKYTGGYLLIWMVLVLKVVAALYLTLWISSDLPFCPLG